MDKNPITQILSDTLSAYLDENSIGIYPGNGICKYVFAIGQYHLEIIYDVMDKFYQIKMEDRPHNALENVAFFTKSRQYHKEVKRRLQERKLPPKALESHMAVFADLLKSQLAQSGDLQKLMDAYPADRKFDGFLI